MGLPLSLSVFSGFALRLWKQDRYGHIYDFLNVFWINRSLYYYEITLYLR